MQTLTTDEILKIEYDSPLSVARLFEDKMIRYTLSYVFSRFIEETNEARNSKFDYLEPVVLNSTHNVFLVEYNFLIRCLSDLSSNRNLLINDFSLDSENTKNSMMLIVGILEEYLNLLKMNSKKINSLRKSEVTYRPGFYKQVIIKYNSNEDDDVHYVQMNAVIFTQTALQKLLNEKLMQELMSVVHFSAFSQEPGVFGSKACAQFWITHKNALRTYNEK